MTDTPAPVTPRTFGQAFGEVMRQHPTADARLVNTILREVFEREAAAPAATEALRAYGRHFPECAAIQQGGDFLAPCDCGFAAALASPEPTPATTHPFTCAYCTGSESGGRLVFDTRDDFTEHMEMTHFGLRYEPTPDSGLDVERLRQAMILAGWPADGSTATSSIIAAEYARLSSADPSEPEPPCVHCERLEEHEA